MEQGDEDRERRDGHTHPAAQAIECAFLLLDELFQPLARVVRKLDGFGQNGVDRLWFALHASSLPRAFNSRSLARMLHEPLQAGHSAMRRMANAGSSGDPVITKLPDRKGPAVAMA